ncbi:hypothetical protein L1080_036595 [Rhodococcus sp. MSC1_016]|uniref:hypothetical protein n=1 Tax=Rhodococcus sp. MSC1_016 TaxID=2909266 RepID=UPI0020306160|nr:hypothetical protein [Rhodococcus sp. MSC1_016]
MTNRKSWTLLRSRGVRAHSFDVLSGLRVRELRATLTAGTGGRPTGHKMHQPRRQGQRGARHRRHGTVTQGAD